MGYFSSGGEGLDYQETYCFKCQLWPESETENCPIWSAHQFFNGEDAAEFVLDYFIPKSEDGLHNLECTFFKPATEGDDATI